MFTFGLSKALWGFLLRFGLNRGVDKAGRSVWDYYISEHV